MNHDVKTRTADYAIDIDVATRFLDDQSAPEEDRYVFAYTIHIRNRGKVPARLLGAALGDHRRQRQGRGSATAKAWSASSRGCVPARTSNTPPARCWKPASAPCAAATTMLADDGTRFDAPIPAFTLTVPRTLH